jgi:AraC family transcriptional regulator
MSETSAEPTPEIKSMQLVEQPTAVMRETVPMNALPEFFGRAFGAVMAAVQNQGVQVAGPPFGL